MKIYTKLIDLSVGDKFYYEDLVYVLMNLIIDTKTKELEMNLKRFKSHEFLHVRISSGYNNFMVYRFARRDKSSFNAGFQRAMDICRKHMTVQQLVDAGFINDVGEHLRMLNEFKDWRQNIKV